ncbi:GNAT family N-acetyltransferase [Leyella lascolaii]|uniref:GNAT family N-acetyltransferase n=1 Tax=Leyella lascolaii TaxID=1776379 RepID=A0AAW7JNK0_9BACT|nr:GNAT family N-acetyltransferase [Leyella lascolaii]MDN0022689.1 GNAT family N-acetyltransferase [Leyella lascolaii]MDN0025843.1 GNAT family N-acetyltransferase [Leyella lascolaii]
MKLRPFSIEDAPVILSWIKDKTDFRKWSADRYSSYPPKSEDMLAQYANDIIFPFTAIDDAGKVIGHIILRYPDSSKTVIRLGFIIIDNQLRGKGYGKQMLELAIQKAQRDYKVQKITLGVFDNNPSAIRCYESVGFTVTGTDTYLIDGEQWMGKEMEIHIMDKPVITKACLEDLQEILQLQYLAYQSEAALFGSNDIPPLKQTIDEVIEEYHKGVILKLVADNKIIGSIRAWETEGTAHVGKLMVHPDYRHCGYGTKLLNEIESYFSQKRFVLFTSTRSINNLRMYQRMGYKEFERKDVTAELEFIYLEKKI